MVMYHDLSYLNGVAPIAADRVSASVSAALALGGTYSSRTDGQRWDSSGGLVAPPGAALLDEYSRRCDAELIQKLGGRLGPNVLRHYQDTQQFRIREAQARADAAGVRLDANYLPGGVGGFPRDFEYIRSKIWEEPMQPLSGLTLFPIDTSVPLGARTHTARRELAAGTAAIHRGGTEVPRATIGYVEKQFGTAIIVCSAGQNFFEQLTLDFAGIQQYEASIRKGKRLVEERMNDLAFFGDEASNIRGVLTYPDLPKVRLALDFDDVAANYQAQIRMLHDLGNEPRIRSGTRMSPNRLAVSPKLMGYLSTRKHDQDGGADTTMLEYYLRTNVLGIRSVDEVPELAGIGPNGEDGILFWRDDSNAIQNVVIQTPTTLPVYQSSPLDQITVIYAVVGGIVAGDVGNHVLGYAQVNYN